MREPPSVLLSCAMSIDGYIDDSAPNRLLLSNDEDFDRVEAAHELGRRPENGRRRAPAVPAVVNDHEWLRLACDLARLCPLSETAFSVGAVVVASDGQEIARGYSRETDPHVHAEESALAKIASGDPRLPGATIYSSLEPCSQRRSRAKTCSQLIVDSGIRRVVMAWHEPDLFADGRGAEELAAAGVTVRELPELAAQARLPNAHLVLG